MTSIVAIDQGTTSSRVILFSAEGQELKSAQRELTLHYPQNGWVEQDASAIWRDVRDLLADVTNSATDIAAIGITNQRETTVVWDRKTGKPVYNAIVWQDRRGADMCRALRDKGLEDQITAKTGLLLDPYFSATKLSWILDNFDGIRMRAEKGELAFGTIDSWLLWNLTGGKVHATDITNASRTLLYNVRDCQWDDELLEIFNIPRAILPEVKENVADFGVAQLKGIDVPIKGMAGDQHAAMIGQACFTPGMIKSTYGTGCFALMNIGADLRLSKNRLLTTIAYKINGEIAYAVEGSIFIAGAVIQWLRDNVKFFEKSSDSRALAVSVKDTGGVYFVPCFTGLGAPYWEPDARAGIVGMTRDTTSAHITRAAIEAQAYQTRDLMHAMEQDGGTNIDVLRIDGGLSANDFMCQFLSDMLDCPVEVPENLETTALGAAYLAGLGAGIFESIDDISTKWKKHRVFTPSIDAKTRDDKYTGWQKAIGKIRA